MKLEKHVRTLNANRTPYSQTMEYKQYASNSRHLRGAGERLIGQYFITFSVNVENIRGHVYKVRGSGIFFTLFDTDAIFGHQ
jgi:hypothetical protein